MLRAISAIVTNVMSQHFIAYDTEESWNMNLGIFDACANSGPNTRKIN